MLRPTYEHLHLHSITPTTPSELIPYINGGIELKPQTAH